MKLNLQKNFFTETKKELISFGSFKIQAFRYSSGVEALEIENSKCSFIFTPFKGQQVWHLKVNGEEISMKSTVDEPTASSLYLKNYGGFIYHCGVISFGAPDGEHPHHGEIPNEIYNSAYISCGEDEDGKYILLGGELLHNTAFVRKYRFAPEIKLYENSSVFKINVTLENQRSYPLEYMYLCHINFRPFDEARIISTAKYDSENFTVYKSEGSKALTDYMDAVEKNPAIMDTVGGEGQCYDPEICFGLRYNTDEDNRAYSLQYREDGACYVSHPADALPYGIRWVSRTENEDAIGIVLPATGEHLGYENAKAKGQIKLLGANETLNFYMEAGWLDKNDADKVKEKIEKINN